MRHFGRVPLLFVLASCSCKGCVEPEPPLEEAICIDPVRQTPRDEVCDELCPPERRVSWRPVGTATCDDFGPWAASRPNANAFVPLEWWQIASFEVPALDLDAALAETLLGILPMMEPDPGPILILLENLGFDLSPEDEAAITALVEGAVDTAEDIDPASVCVYVWTGAGDPVGFPPDTEPDCIVAGEAPPPQPLEADLADAFQSSIGIPGLAEVSAAAGSQEPVMIAVVDTSPPGAGGGNAVHGQAIASIIEQVACGAAPPGPCALAVRRFLGLPRVLGPDGVSVDEDPSGGYFGFQSDLTRGLQEAMNEWMSAPPSTKLVVNLSVGWEPTCSASSRVVEPVVAQAVERGALVLAASGNRRLGSCIEGPVAPAAWTDLVHAVTPVDDALDDLVTFRPGSNARIAAHGFMAVTSSGGTTHGPLSGSSVSTAVVSGAAALVWSYRPWLTADQVMDLLWASGEERQVSADFYRGAGTAPTQRVVTACRALASALNVLAASPIPCKSPTRPDVRDLWGNAPILVADVVELTLEDAPTSTVSCPWCSGAELDTKVFGSPPVPALADPWGVPQPDNAGCPMCGIKLETTNAGTSGTARLIRAPFYANMELVSTTITLWDAAGRSRVIQYDASVLPLVPGTLYEVTSADLTNIDGDGSEPVRGHVTLVFLKGSQQLSIGNEIPIWDQTLTAPTPATP